MGEALQIQVKYSIMEKRRFTDHEVRGIRESQKSLTSSALAQEYGVSHPTILNIWKRRTYREVPDYSSSDPVMGLKGLENSYIRKDALGLLAALPAGSCHTVVTSPFFSKNYRRVISGEITKYISWQRNVISECIRVAGPQGIVLYHGIVFNDELIRSLSAKHELIRGLPLSKIITWHHFSGNLTLSHSLQNQMPSDSSEFFVFAGENWSIPDELVSWEKSNITEPDKSVRWRSLSSRHRRDEGIWHDWTYFTDELADICIGLGTGVVLDPFASIGAVPLACHQSKP